MMRKLIIICIILGSLSCRKQEKVLSDVDYEISVINNIFSQLHDNICHYGVYPPPPPPPPPAYDKNGNNIGYDTLIYKEYLKQYEIEKEKHLKDTSKYVLAVYDTLISSYGDIKYLKNSHDTILIHYTEPIDSMINSSKDKSKLDISQIHCKDRYSLKYLSEFPPRTEIWNRDYDFKLGGVLVFSRIYFDSEKKYGVFYCSYTCGRLCGTGYIILIEKIGENWEIKDVFDMWIS